MYEGDAVPTQGIATAAIGRRQQVAGAVSNGNSLDSLVENMEARLAHAIELRNSLRNLLDEFVGAEPQSPNVTEGADRPGSLRGRLAEANEGLLHTHNAIEGQVRRLADALGR